MYNFIFWFFFKYFEWRDKFKSSFVATTVVCFTFAIHFFAVYSVSRYFFGRTIGVFSENYIYNKLVMLSFVILFFFLVYTFYYKRKADEILGRFKEKRPFIF